MPFSIARLPFAAVCQPPVTAKLPHSLTPHCCGEFLKTVLGLFNTSQAWHWELLASLLLVESLLRRPLIGRHYPLSASHDTLTLATLTASEESLRLR